MEDSFDENEFRSLVNPSPTFKVGAKEVKRKPPTKLALKKKLRRSSMYDRLIQSIDNAKINMVDAETTESGSYSSLSTSPQAERRKPRKGFIIVNDSECNSIKTGSDKNIIEPSDDDEKVMIAKPESKETKSTVKENELLSKTKFESIQNWVQSVAVSETIYSTKDTPKEAINSTFALDKTCIAFDKWIKKAQKSSSKTKDLVTHKPKQDKENKPVMPETPNQLLKKYLNSDDVENILHDDDFLTEKKTSKAKNDGFTKGKLNKLNHNKDSRDVIKKKEELPVKKPSSDKNIRNNVLKTHNSGGKKQDDPVQLSEVKVDDVLITPVKQKITQNDDVTSLLDTLYGNSWHKNKEEIFSEPRRPKLQIHKLKKPLTERKPPRELLYKNPYLDSEKEKSKNLLKALQERRIQETMASPFFARPKCVDDDTSSLEDKEEQKTSESGFKHKDVFNMCDLDASLDDDGVTIKKKPLPKPTKLKFTEEGTKNLPKTTKKVHKRLVILSDSDSDDDCDNNLKTGRNLENNKPNTRKVSSSSTSSTSSTNSSEADRRPIRKISSSTSSSSSRSDNSENKRPARKKNIGKTSNELADRIDRIVLDDSCSDSSLILDSDSDSELEKPFTKPKKTPVIAKSKQPQPPKVHSFLTSLSKRISNAESDPTALIYKNNFKKHRDALAKTLFDLFNEKIFDKCIPSETPIEWSVRMTGTAGLCRCMRSTHRNGIVTRSVRLKLSTKVLDSADRLRDTLVHEMCHAATYLINEVSDGHGPYWKAWAAKAMRAFPELPPIKRCHDYAINYKYTYKCTSCGYSFGRHSKSLDLERKRCGYCYGKFEVMLNKTNQGGDKKSVPCTPKKEATGFAKFVKDNYALHKSPGVSHAALMKQLGKKYAEVNGKK